MVIHGAGGGADQGLRLGHAFVGGGVRLVATARFGYTGSPLPPDASTTAQVDALAALMDALSIETAGVLGVSGGAPSALQRAIRHPARVSGLILASSAPFGSMADPAADRGAPQWTFDAAFALEAPFAILARVWPESLWSRFDSRPDLMADLGDANRRFVAALLDAFHPVRPRRDGMRNEGAVLAGGDPLERIAMPTLVVHAREDGMNPFAIGSELARRSPGAALLVFDRGGHRLLGHAATLREATAPVLAPRKEDWPCRPFA